MKHLRSRWQLLVSIGLFAGGVSEAILTEPQLSVAGAVALYAVIAAALALRLRYPLLVAAVVPASDVVSGALGGVTGAVTMWLAFTVAYYGLGRHMPPQHGRRAWLLVAAVSAAYIPASDGRLENWLAAAGVSILIPFLAGLQRARQVHARELQRQADDREREHADAVERAAEDERSRLARELHDIVSHTVGTIAVQAQATDALMDRDPAAARSSVYAIQDGARSAMVELRRLLALLRADDPNALRTPQPGLAELPGLVERMRAAGLEVDLTEDDGDELPPAIDLSAYRIVQEGLTNVLVHSGAHRATVTIARDHGSLDRAVCDAGHGTQAQFGAGLTGMRERVALLGGEFDAGPADPGWRIHVRLPLNGIRK